MEPLGSSRQDVDDGDDGDDDAHLFSVFRIVLCRNAQRLRLLEPKIRGAFNGRERLWKWLTSAPPYICASQDTSAIYRDLIYFSDLPSTIPPTSRISAMTICDDLASCVLFGEQNARRLVLEAHKAREVPEIVPISECPYRDVEFPKKENAWARIANVNLKTNHSAFRVGG